MARATDDADEQAVETVRAQLDVARARALAGFDVLRDIDGTPAEVEANRHPPLPEQPA
ncbi:MAG: hypothetical protein JSS99_08290 [Actinobacteria bacterium]|nr:hypothetical protein [Actinomycetota bacterium]